IVAWPGLAQRLPRPALDESSARTAGANDAWFSAMGIGMSLPWLLIVAWPGLAQRLPRPALDESSARTAGANDAWFSA
ncbi:hypothetical protein G7L33_26655, partial [Klebsiella quasipneumoniae]|nr:hypothetical protein [Klebsiella quasipneumoniae]